MKAGKLRRKNLNIISILNVRCHYALHLLGKQLFDVFPTVKLRAALHDCYSFCTMGCVHGLIQGYRGVVSREGVGACCAEFETDQGIFDCWHGRTCPPPPKRKHDRILIDVQSGTKCKICTLLPKLKMLVEIYPWGRWHTRLVPVGEQKHERIPL